MSFKENLMTALNGAVAYRNGGADDNEAVAKAASDNNFNQQQTRRLAETYNTAKTIYFYKSAEDRGGAFTIADPDVVLGIMVTPEQEERKSASAAVGLYDYSEYDRRETDWLDGTDKAASSLDTHLDTITSDRNIDDVVYSLQRNSSDVTRTAEHCKSAADMCLVKYTEAIDKIASFVRLEHGVEKDIYPITCSGIEAVLGKEAAAPVIRDLDQWVPNLFRSPTAGPDISTFDTDHPGITAVVKTAAEALGGYAESMAASEQFNKMAEEFESEWKDILFGTKKAEADSWVDDVLPGEFHEKVAQSAPSSYNVGDLLAESRTVAKPVADFGDSIAGVIGKGVTGAVSPAISSVMSAQPSGPSGENLSLQEKLRNVQRQQILEDLMVNDEVIAGEDPQKVTNAYQALLQTAPHVSLNKEVVRSVLRQASQAASISPFDAKSWADLEGSIAKQTQQTPTKDNSK